MDLISKPRHKRETRNSKERWWRPFLGRPFFPEFERRSSFPSTLAPAFEFLVPPTPKAVSGIVWCPWDTDRISLLDSSTMTSRPYDADLINFRCSSVKNPIGAAISRSALNQTPCSPSGRCLGQPAVTIFLLTHLGLFQPGIQKHQKT